MCSVQRFARWWRSLEVPVAVCTPAPKAGPAVAWSASQLSLTAPLAHAWEHPASATAYLRPWGPLLGSGVRSGPVRPG